MWRLLLLCASVYCLPVLVVELGSDTIRGTVVDLTNPNALSVVDVIIDEQSERRQPSMVGFSSPEDPEFGHSAAAQFQRTGQALPGLIRLLGAEQQALSAWQADYGSHLKAVQKGDDWVFASNLLKGVEMSVNEAISLQLQHFQRIADAHLKQTGQFKEPITHTVLVVPADFTQAQRQTYSQLAEAAGLTVDLVVGDLAAAAVDYGVRNPEVCDQGKKVMMYTLGAHGASGLAVQFGWTGEGDKKTVQVTELQAASDRTVGGATFTARIRDLLIGKFAPKTPLSPKAEAKVLKAAAKAKHALSVGKKAQVFIEELSEGRDLKTEVTVEEFNQAIENLLPGCVKPLQTLLATGVTGIELVGGGWRVPAVRKAIEQAAGQVEVGRHVDADEGIILGASTLGAVFISQLEGTPLPSHLPSAQLKQLVSVGELPSKSLRDRLVDKLQQWKAKFEAKQRAEVARNQFQSAINALREAVEESGDKLGALKEQADSALEQAAAVDAEAASGAELEAQLQQLQKVTTEVEAALAKQRAAAEKAAPKKKSDKKTEDRKKAQKQRERDAAIKQGKADSAKKQKEAEKRKKSKDL